MRQATAFSEVRAARGHPALTRVRVPLRVLTSGIAPKVFSSLAPACARDFRVPRGLGYRSANDFPVAAMNETSWRSEQRRSATRRNCVKTGR